MEQVNLAGDSPTAANTENYIVIYRKHGDLMLETRYFGPFTDYLKAEEFLCGLPAIGVFIDELHKGRKGVKFIEPLISASEVSRAP